MSVGQRRPGFEVLDHIIDKHALEQVCITLSLSDAQSSYAQSLFETYFQAVKRIDRETLEQQKQIIEQFKVDQHELDSADNADDALAIEAERTNTLKVLWTRSLREADAQLMQFFEELSTTLTEQQLEQLPAAKRMVRRLNHLPDPDHRPDDEPDALYYRFDLMPVIQRASSEEGELHELMTPPFSSLSESQQAARTAIIEALLNYELQVDDLLLRKELKGRKRKHYKPGETRIFLDTPKGQRWMKRSGDQWCRWFRILDEPARTIAQALRDTTGEQSARRWERRYWRSWNKKAFGKLPLDKFPAWQAVQTDLTEDQQAVLDVVYQQFLTRRQELHRRILTAASAAMCETGTVKGNEREHLEYAQAILDLLQMHEQTLDQLAYNLSPEPGAALRKQFTDPWVLVHLRDLVSMHTAIVTGLIDPEQYRAYIWDKETQMYLELRPVISPESGLWRLESIAEARPHSHPEQNQ